MTSQPTLKRFDVAFSCYLSLLQNPAITSGIKEVAVQKVKDAKGFEDPLLIGDKYHELLVNAAIFHADTFMHHFNENQKQLFEKTKRRTESA